MRNFLVAAVLVLFVNSAQADLVVSMTEVSGGQVHISWSGMGTVSGDDSTGDFQLWFDDLSGSPFNAGIASGAGSTFALSSDLTFEGTDASNAGASYENTYASVVLINNTNANNLRLEGGAGTTGLGDGDSYSVSGSAIVNSLSFADLNVGTYTSTSPDASLFGSMTLVVSAVPEPSAFLFGTVVCLATGLRRRR